MTGSNLVVCLDNIGYEASLDRGGRYARLPDEDAAKHALIRVIDESGEDYLYPESCFSAGGANRRSPADAGSAGNRGRNNPTR